MQVLERQQHHTTLGLGGRARRRVLSNHCNWQTKSGLWMPTLDGSPELATGIPDDWEGRHDFRYHKLDGPLQAFGGDTTDVDNTTLVGARSSANPEFWINFKALHLDNLGVDPEPVPGERTLLWRLPWVKADLAWEMARHAIRKTIRLRQPGHPPSFRFAFRLPERLDYVIEGNWLRIIRKDNGRTVIESRPAWGEDAVGEPVRVALTEGPPAGGYPTLVLTPDPDDLAAAVYPVTLDPTVVISGTTDIEDNVMRSPGSHLKNYGGYHTAAYGFAAGTTWRTIARIRTGALPAGTITSFVWDYSQLSNSFTGTGGTIESFVIKAANPWVEGTASGSTQAGSSSWQYIADPTGWAGTPGCSTPGTDYVADASPPTMAYGAYTTGPAKTLTYNLPTQWVSDWRDAVLANEGFMTKNQDEISIHLLAGSTTEGTDPWTFTIGYNEGIPFPAGALARRR